MKKLEFPDMKKEWNDIFEAIDKKNLKFSESEIQKEVAETRKHNRWSNAQIRSWHQRPYPNLIAKILLNLMSVVPDNMIA